MHSESLWGSLSHLCITTSTWACLSCVYDSLVANWDDLQDWKPRKHFVVFPACSLLENAKTVRWNLRGKSTLLILANKREMGIRKVCFSDHPKTQFCSWVCKPCGFSQSVFLASSRRAQVWTTPEPPTLTYNLQNPTLCAKQRGVHNSFCCSLCPPPLSLVKCCRPHKVRIKVERKQQRKREFSQLSETHNGLHFQD